LLNYKSGLSAGKGDVPVNIELVRDNKVYFNTYTCMKRLLENCLNRQCRVMDNNTRDAIGGRAFTKEYCTVKVSSARMCGHTTAILKIANDCFDKSMIISSKLDQSRRIEHMIQCDYPNSMEKFETISLGSLSHARGNLYENKLEAVFVDIASVISDSRIEEVYDTFLPILCMKPHYFFIFVE